ncbi:hypothetical protein BH11PSE13_BH11PSE13_11390 [soil metagenome]
MVWVPELKVSRQTDGGDTITVELRFGCAPELVNSSPYEQAAGLFMACASRGAFCQASEAPRVWKLVQGVSAHWSGPSLTLLLRIEHFDARGLQVLRNLLVGAAEPENRIDGIVVKVPMELRGYRRDEQAMPMLDEDNEDDEYPALSERLGFDCVDEEVDDTWVRRCVIEYAAPVSPEEVERLEHWVEPWFNLLEMGGYALPIGLPENVQSAPGGVNQFDEFSIEISLMKFHASEMAWHALANMLSARCVVGTTIIRLVFD